MVKGEWVPYHLKANTSSTASLALSIKNVAREPLLTSVTVSLPKGLKFDKAGAVKSSEVRLGTIDPGLTKETMFDVMGDVSTGAGTYVVELTVYAHYGDYAHVMNSVRKNVHINVVA